MREHSEERRILKKIKQAFLNAFIHLGGQNQEYRDRILQVIKGTPFYHAWQTENRPPLVREKGGWDTLHKIFEGLFKSFLGVGGGLLVASGILVALILVASITSVLISFWILPGILSIAGIFCLGGGLLFGLCFLIVGRIKVDLNRQHEKVILESIGGVAYETARTEDLSDCGYSYLYIIRLGNEEQTGVFFDTLDNTSGSSERSPTPDEDVLRFPQQRVPVHQRGQTQLNLPSISGSSPF